jgi:hypothetical protein
VQLLFDIRTSLAPLGPVFPSEERFNHSVCPGIVFFKRIIQPPVITDLKKS